MSSVLLSPNLQVLLIAALVLCVVAAFFPSFLSMSESWSTESYRHGYAVPLIFAYLLLHARSRVSTVEWRPSALGTLLLCPFVAIWVLAVLTGIQIAEQLAVIGMLSSLALAVGGWGVYRPYAFALAFLLLMVPLGEELIRPLMIATADISSFVVRLLGIPIFRDGMYLQLPGGNFEVASACSGFRYFNAGVAIALLAGKLFFRQWRHRITYLALVIAVFVLVNGVRAALVMVIAAASEMTILVGEDHIVFGAVLFAIAMMAMLLLGQRLSVRYGQA